MKYLYSSLSARYIASLLSLWTLAVSMPVGAQFPPPSSQNKTSHVSPLTTIDFDHFKIGPITNDFTPILSGLGKAVSWEIRQDPAALSGKNVLAQTSYDQVDYRFPLLVYNNITAKNVQVTVQFRPVSGKIDQAAGVIFRYQDPEHFYVVRANALEDNVQLYRVVKGIRQVITGQHVHVATGQWHSLEITAQGNQITVVFDDKQLFEVRDDTFSSAGRIGLSTKSDGVTIFDNLQVTVLD